MKIANLLSEIEKTVNNKKIKTSVFLLHKVNYAKNQFLKQCPEEQKNVSNILFDLKIKPIAELKQEIKNKINKHKKQIKQAEGEIPRIVAQKIKKGSVVFVYGYSPRVLNALKTAKENGTKFTLLTADSGPEQKGKKVLEQANKMGIDVKHYSDILIPNALEKADIMLFEPQGISSRKKLVAFQGINNILEAARNKNVATYCVLNSLELSNKKDNYEETRENFITAVINHQGIVRPSEFRRNSLA